MTLRCPRPVWIIGLRSRGFGLSFAGYSITVMLRFNALLIALFFQTVLATAREGYVQTRDGKVYEGHLRFESNTVVIVNAGRELWAEVALTNLASVIFESVPAGATLSSLTDRHGELPGPWSSDDIGSVRHPGGAEFRGNAFQVWSSGTNVLADSDSCHFVFKPVRGTSELVARVTKVQLTDPWARAGLMMRESLAANSRNVFLAVTAARGGVFQWRERLGEETSATLDRAMSVPYWLKLKREGNVFTALKSPNAKQWVVVERLTMSAAKDLYVGLAVVGVRDAVLNQSVFEQVEEGPSLRNRWFVPQVQLQSGTMHMGYIARMDDTAIRFETASDKEPVSTLNVANIRFQPLPSRYASALNTGRVGVLLSSGEFIDGECRAIEDGRVVLSSVPLGLCRYDVNNDVVAVVLRKRTLAPKHACELKTVDGSVWLGSEVGIDARGVLIRELSLGPRRIPMHEVLELRRDL